MKMLKGSFVYNGVVTNDLLDMGYQQFQIIKLSGDEIKIGDDDYIHVLKPFTIASVSAQITEDLKTMSFPSEPVTSMDTALLKGIWEPYKKERKKGTIGKINYKALLKKIDFDNKSLNQIIGVAFIGNNISYQIMEMKNGKFTAKESNGNTHLFTIWRINTEEIILEDEDGMIYFLKQF